MMPTTLLVLPQDGLGVTIEPKGEIKTGGAYLCYLAMDRNDAFVLGADYMSETVFTVDGSSLECSSLLKLPGDAAMVNPARQEASHAHCFAPHPSLDVGFVCDLGTGSMS
jgi:6-phosphogluconolactonase (cycloisomerase 2 family)